MNKITKNSNSTQTENTIQQLMNTKHRIIKHTNKIHTKEQMKLLNLGPQFTMKPKHNRHKSNYHRNRKSHQRYGNKRKIRIDI